MKKQISTVAAVLFATALTANSFAAEQMYKDIPANADYGQAVQALTDLNIIAGYEDDTFGPDKLITRAEAAKLMVSAINMNKAADELKGETVFKDIDAESEWANGYINVGFQKGYINGMSKDEFAPKENVTYAQMVKMLVTAMGYGDYAYAIGEYPNGYLKVAEFTGFLDGAVNPGESITRAQAAKLIYSAIKSPIVTTEGVDLSDGEKTARIKLQNGSADNFYKSILTEAFNSYYVEGYIKATPKTDDTLNPDELLFEITKSEKYEQEALSLTEDEETKGSYKKVKVKLDNAADTEPAGSYCVAIIKVDENGNCYLESLLDL